MEKGTKKKSSGTQEIKPLGNTAEPKTVTTATKNEAVSKPFKSPKGDVTKGNITKSDITKGDVTKTNSPKTDERADIAAAKTKSHAAAKTIQRLPNMPRLVSKDTDLAASTKIEHATIDLDIDKSMFEDSASEKEVKIVSRSVTIDGNMLSQEKAASIRKKRPKIINSDFSAAERFESDHITGLSGAQVEKRQDDGFINATRKKTGKSFGRIFISNIFTFFNMLTFIVAAALIIVGAGFNQLFFMVIITANIAIGIIQEIKSKLAVDKLNLITAPSALVMRDGKKIAIPVTEVVLDDIMYLEMGKQICSDAVVIKGDIEVNESMLTGESIPMRKSVGSELYSGSFVTSGNCYARAHKVGAANYVETLTSYAKKYRKPKSELQNSIRLIIKVVAIILIPLTIAMLLNNYDIYKGQENMWNKIVSQVSGAVIGMIPAGMFLLTSTALAVSVIRLAKKKTLVQDLYCIEMLARVDVLCLDKTGTITDGTMKVNNIIEIKGGETEFPLGDVIGSMLSATGDNNQTAMALVNKFGYSSALKAKAVMPFSSQRKISAVTFEGGAGTYMLGAPEFVLKDMGVRIEKMVNENAANGFRVMVLAHSPAEIVGEKMPVIRRPMCLIVIEDHIREDAVATIKWFKENNVDVKVISGDNPITVSEVARRVGVNNAELYISLEGLSDQEVIESANNYAVFGRVTPEQKCLLVKSLKAKGHTVAMTGDGVNDILAMRESDCSIAIASGAEAARNVSHLVLLDNNFTSMPDVVMEGRRVVNNIQKSSSLFLMKTFMSMALSLIFLIMRKPYPFTTANLLLLELLVIGLASFCLAMQKNNNIIKGKFLSNVIGRCVPGGITLVMSTMAVYLYNSFMPNIAPEVFTCLMVLTLTFTGMIILYKNCEPFDGFRTVLMLSIAALSIVAVTFMPDFFGITKIGLTDLLFVICVVLAGYFVVSIMMKIMRFAKVLN